MEDQPFLSNNTSMQPSQEVVMQQNEVSMPAPETPEIKQKKKKLLIGVICVLLILLAGGAFLALYLIKSRPENIVASAMNNLISAEHISLEGDVNVVAVPENGNEIKIGLRFLRSGINFSNTTSVQIKLPFFDIYTPIDLEISEAIISNNTLYFKLKGGGKLVDTIITTYSKYASPNGSFSDTLFNGILTTAKNVSKVIEDRWIKVSIEEVLSIETLSLSDYQKQEILSKNNCVTDKINNISNYSDEFSTLLQKHPFINLTKEKDSFYDVSVNAKHLAGFTIAVPETKLYKDIKTCLGSEYEGDITISEEQIQENIEKSLDSFPKISAKFEGFLDYRLTELKISKEENSMSFDSDLRLNYSGDTNVEVPTNATSIVDIVEEIQELLDNE